MIDYIPTGSIDLQDTIESFKIQQFDNNSHKVYITIIDKDNPFGENINLRNHTINAYFKLPDGSDEYTSCEIVKADKGKIAIVIPGTVTQQIGTVRCQITITGIDNSFITLKTFSFEVIESIFNSSAIESSEQYSALVQCMSNYQQIQLEIAQKAPLFHTHSLENIENLNGVLAQKAPLFHTHYQSDIIGSFSPQEIYEIAYNAVSNYLETQQIGTLGTMAEFKSYVMEEE